MDLGRGGNDCVQLERYARNDENVETNDVGGVVRICVVSSSPRWGANDQRGKLQQLRRAGSLKQGSSRRRNGSHPVR